MLFSIPNIIWIYKSTRKLWNSYIKFVLAKNHNKKLSLFHNSILKWASLNPGKSLSIAKTELYSEIYFYSQPAYGHSSWLEISPDPPELCLSGICKIAEV